MLAYVLKVKLASQLRPTWAIRRRKPKMCRRVLETLVAGLATARDGMIVRLREDLQDRVTQSFELLLRRARERDGQSVAQRTLACGTCRIRRGSYKGCATGADCEPAVPSEAGWAQLDCLDLPDRHKGLPLVWQDLVETALAMDGQYFLADRDCRRSAAMRGHLSAELAFSLIAHASQLAQGPRVLHVSPSLWSRPGAERLASAHGGWSSGTVRPLSMRAAGPAQVQCRRDGHQAQRDPPRLDGRGLESVSSEVFGAFVTMAARGPRGAVRGFPSQKEVVSLLAAVPGPVAYVYGPGCSEA